MKKTYLKSFCARFLTLLVLALMSTNLAWGGETTFTPNSETTTSGVNISPITFAFTDGSTPTKWYNDGLRFYEGATITVSSESTITKIEFTHGVGNNGCLILDGSTGTYSSKVWTGSAKSIKFKVTHSSGDKNGQVKLTKVVVTYEGAAKTLKSIAISGTPTKTTYEAGEEFDYSDLVVIGTYDDESTAEITSGITWEVTPSGALTAGTTSVSVTATVDGKSDSKSYDVTVNAIEGDRLTLASTGVTGTSYTAWTGKTGSGGVAVYAGKSAGSYSSIQLNATSPNGLVSTTSGGLIRKVKVDWNTNTSSTGNRSIDIYGSNTAYTGSGDIYDNEKQGTKLGSIVCGTSTELEISGDYEYVGVRAIGGALYMNSITFIWSTPKELTSIAVKTAPTAVYYAVGELFNPAGLVITATYEDESTADIAYEGNEDKFSFSPALDVALATTDEQVTITYGGQSCNQAITVKNIELTSIVVSGDLAVTEYTEGDDFDFTGLVATGFYSDDTNKTITDQVEWSIDPATLTAGQTSVSVIATSGSISGNKSYNITVNEAPKVIDNWNALFNKEQDGSVTVSQNSVDWSGSTSFGVTINIKNGSSTSSYLKNNDVRLYNGYTMTITAPENKQITQIDATEAGKSIASLSSNVGNLSISTGGATMTWTGKASEIVLSASGTTSFATMTFTLADKLPSVANPTFVASVEPDEEGKNWNPIEITLETTTEGATILYSIDGTAPSLEYTAPFTVSATTTIKAIAKKAGIEDSEEVSKTYTFGPVYSSISDLVKAGEPTGTGHTVKVTFSNIVTGFYTTGAGNRNGVYVNVKYTKDDFVEIYCEGVDKDWAVGGMVEGTLKCTWKRYSGTWELCPENWNDVTYTAPAVTNVTVSTYGWATYYVPFDATVSGDATAYYVTTTDGNLSKTLITESEHIVAGTGVLLKGQEGEEKTATFTPVELDEEKVADEWYDNQLQGTNVVGGETFNDTGYKYYILTLGGDDKVGFYWDPETNNEGASATCPAGKAVLAVPASSEAKAFFSLDSEPTGITSYENENDNENLKAMTVYNLNGMKVNNSYKGIVIMNGKKYINK